MHRASRDRHRHANSDADTVADVRANANAATIANNTPADRAVPAVEVVCMAADRNDAMIDELLSKQLSIARRIRMAARRGNSGKALELYWEWRQLDKRIKELCY